MLSRQPEVDDVRGGRDVWEGGGKGGEGRMKG
jgi:hypothetical protein